MAGFSIAGTGNDSEARQPMLKLYDKLDDVPEALREHYKLIDGRYVPELSDDHPVKLNNTKLLNEKTVAETKAANLQGDLDSAKASSLPRGHMAVLKADAELLEQVKALGNLADLKVKLTEYESMSADLAKRKRADSLKAVAKELGYNDEVFSRLSDLPEFDIREKDGKKSIVALTRDGDKVIEKAGQEFIESTYAPFMPALKVAQSGLETPGSGGGQSQGGKDPYASAREFAKSWNENAKAGTDVESRFGLAKSA